MNIGNFRVFHTKSLAFLTLICCLGQNCLSQTVPYIDFEYNAQMYRWFGNDNIHELNRLHSQYCQGPNKVDIFQSEEFTKLAIEKYREMEKKYSNLSMSGIVRVANQPTGKINNTIKFDKNTRTFVLLPRYVHTINFTILIEKFSKAVKISAIRQKDSLTITSEAFKSDLNWEVRINPKKEYFASFKCYEEDNEVAIYLKNAESGNSKRAKLDFNCGQNSKFNLFSDEFIDVRQFDRHEFYNDWVAYESSFVYGERCYDINDIMVLTRSVVAYDTNRGISMVNRKMSQLCESTVTTKATKTTTIRPTTTKRPAARRSMHQKSPGKGNKKPRTAYQQRQALNTNYRPNPYPSVPWEEEGDLRIKWVPMSVTHPTWSKAMTSWIIGINITVIFLITFEILRVFVL